MKKVILFLSVIVLLLSCGVSENTVIHANSNTVFTVNGMTCETGCAKRIERKIAKMKGVKSCEVNFEDEITTVIYDNKLVKSDDFVALIEEINDNQYKVSNLKTEKINNTNSESTSNGKEKIGSILSGSSFEMPNIMQYLRNII